MSHRKPTTRLFASALAAVLTPALALGGTLLVPVHEARAADRVDCKAHAVHLTKQGDGKIPSNLKFIEAELKDDQFAAYKGFALLESKTLTLEGDKPAAAKFKTRHRLKLRLLGKQDGKLKLHTTLFSRAGDKKLVDMDYAIADKGVLLLGGSKHEGGKLLFVLRCAMKKS